MLELVALQSRQVRVDDLLRVPQRRRRALDCDRASVEQVGVVGDSQCEFGVLFDEEDRKSLGVQLGY